MVFSSMTFAALFLPLVFFFYFVLRGTQARNWVLLVFSLVFYAWGEPKWILVMLLTVTVNYFCALLLERAQTASRRRLLLLGGVVISLGFLFYFKYFGFFAQTVAGLLGTVSPFTAPALPIGISFYTFQVLTYTVDVYRGKVQAQRDYSKLLLYVSFFPQLIAGPIVRYSDIAQALERRRHSTENTYEGLLRFFIGFSKKVLLANTCGAVVEKLSGAPLSVVGSWLMAIAFGLQVYFDFSGYSDMAIGLGRVFGFRFRENFESPYISKSVTEFWRRWHISLGAFFREYVYIPLGGNRVSTGKHIRNILIVWLLTGFWHGASWNFLVWGAYYGALLLAEKFLLAKVKDKLPAAVNILLTLLAVLIGWVLFYYESLGSGLSHLGIMFGLGGAPLLDSGAIYYGKHYALFLVCAALACVPWTKTLRLPLRVHGALERLRPLVVTVLLLVSIVLIVGQSYNPFLYFRF